LSERLEKMRTREVTPPPQIFSHKASPSIRVNICVLIERGTKHKSLVYLLKVGRWVVPNATDMFECLEPRAQ
jgi:hypothetical protein